MKEFNIILSSFEAVQEFVNISSKQSYSIRVIADEKQTNAKSLIGFFSMDRTVPMQLLVQADNGTADVATYMSEISKYLI